MSKLDYTIIDNFLNEGVAKNLSDFMIGPNSQFSWYYMNSVVNSDDLDHIHNHQFYRIFYWNWEPRPFFDMLAPITSKLNPIAWQRVKANLNTVTPTKITYPFHTDTETENCAKTAIYYLNTNNGVTILEDGTEIESIANRILIFDQKIKHTGTTCTDQKVRSLINFNYIDT
jgi:hypothetical protein